MQSIFHVDTKAWNEFWERWGDSIMEIPALKEQVLTRAGDALANEVRYRIAQSGLNDSRHGRVKKWQNPHVGSFLGYVAVRSDSVSVMSGGGTKKPLNAGALTNYLTSGHKTRIPSGRSKRYVPRVEKHRVPGFRFYKDATGEAEKIAESAAKEFLDEIREVMGL